MNHTLETASGFELDEYGAKIGFGRLRVGESDNHYRASLLEITELRRRAGVSLPKFDPASFDGPDVIPARHDTPEGIPDECVASGVSCSYAAEGPKGEMQCRYCGKAKPLVSISERFKFEHALARAGFQYGADARESAYVGWLLGRGKL